MPGPLQRPRFLLWQWGPLQDNLASGVPADRDSAMNCPSCDRENSATAVRCLHCGVPLISGADDRTMDSPDQRTMADGGGAAAAPARQASQAAAAALPPPRVTPARPPSPTRSPRPRLGPPVVSR